jgi:hypothetical protein
MAGSGYSRIPVSGHRSGSLLRFAEVDVAPQNPKEGSLGLHKLSTASLAPALEGPAAIVDIFVQRTSDSGH